MAELSPTAARRTLLASVMIINMGFTVLFPVLSPLGRELGFNEIQITSIIAMSSVIVFLSTPVWGRISDRLGRKRVMLIGIFGFCFGTVLFTSVLYAGLAGWVTGWILYGLLVVARMVHASIMSAAMPAATAYMADITSVAERTKGMGAAGAAGNLGSILGPGLAALAVISLLAPLWAIAAVALCNGLLVLLMLPESPRGRSRERPPRVRYSDPRVVPFLVVGVLMFMGFGLVQQTMGFRFQDALGLGAADTAQIVGTAMMLSAGCSLFSQGVIVQRLDIAPFTLLKLALPLLILAFVLMATQESRLWLTLALGIQGLGMGLAGPGFMAGASLAVSAEEQGAVAGVAGSCGPLGWTIGPLLGGALYQYEYWLPYAFTAAVYVVLLGFMPWLGRRVVRGPDSP